MTTETNNSRTNATFVELTGMELMVNMIQARINELVADPRVQKHMLNNVEPKAAEEYIIKTAIATLMLSPEQRLLKES